MVLTDDDMERISALVSKVIAGQQQAQTSPTVRSTETPKQEHIDERHFRKIPIFSGENFTDFSFQFKSAIRSSSGLAYQLLQEAEGKKAKIEDDEDLTPECQTLSSEIFNVITTMV